MTPASFLDSRGDLGKIRRRSDIPPEEAERAIGELREGVERLRLLKDDGKTAVYAGVRVGSLPACFKVYRSARRARRGFLNLCSLSGLGVPVPEPFFLWEAGAGEAAVAMEDLSPRPELDRWLSDRAGDASAAADVEAVCAALGARVRALHERGIYLDDLKTCNVFIDQSPEIAFRFVDVDGVRRGRVDLVRRARNLAQLNRSTPLQVGVRARRAFWREYTIGLKARAVRRLRALAMELSVERPILYVTRRGVKEEPWPARARDWPR